VELDEVAGLAGEDAAETLLLNDEARVVSDKKPLKILGSHCVDCLSSVMRSRLCNDMMVFESERNWRRRRRR